MRNLAADKPFHQSSNSQAVLVKIHEDIFFEYTGDTALTVTGTVTRKQYRFTGNGDIQLIDYRDTGGMMAIPVLRKLKPKTDHNISA
jgi:hypothetical protein